MRRGFVGLIAGLLIFSLLGCSMFDLAFGNTSVRRAKIVGAAMEPNFHDGQIVEIEEVPVADLQRGDIVLFVPDKERQYLKRLIGLTGETLEIIDGKVYIDGKVLEEPYLQETSRVNRFPTPPITLKPNEYYVLGDNRNNSSDSRAFGPISGESILGRVKVPASAPTSRTFLMQQVSMQPTIKEGELLSVEEVPVDQLQRGDIIVFQVPGGKVVHVKRLIGLPGDTVEVRDDKVYVNGKALDEPYIRKPMGKITSPITLGADEYFVMGDNRSNSADSREFGPISGKSILGRVKQ